MLGVAVMIRDKYAVRLAPEQAGRTPESDSGWEKLRPSDRQGADSAARATMVGLLPRWPRPWPVALGTVYRIKQRFSEEGLDRALWDRRQVNRHRKLDDRGEAHLIALACSPAPEGHDHWDSAPAGGQGGGTGVSVLPVPRGSA